MDLNAIETDLTWNARGWLTQTAVRGTDNTTTTDDVITGYAYDGMGDLTTLTEPDGSTYNFTYDAAHRLTNVAQKDHTGALYGSIHYTLDAAGNRTEDDTNDPTGSAKRIVRRAFNSAGQLTVTANAVLSGTSLVPNMSYSYSGAQANVLTDGRGTVTSGAKGQVLQ